METNDLALSVHADNQLAAFHRQHLANDAQRLAAERDLARAADDALPDLEVNAVRIKHLADTLWLLLCEARGHIRPMSAAEVLLKEIRSTRAEIARLASIPEQENPS